MSQHPVIPGFHPDPSICRVGDRYYIANSSFEYFPGIPIFESLDLRSWRPIGSALDRPSQLVVRGGIAGASGGVYAPTLRHHDGRFWMTTTNIHEIARGHLIVHAEDPAGPWSEPVYVSGTIGVDPDLAWDVDGVCHLTWSDIVHGGISQAHVDPFTGVLLSTPQEIWRGSGGAHAEGPHVFARDDWWYLIAAEGGTGPGHMVTVARSRSVDGPYESAPNNPILTHRSTALPVQATGHGDMVELADGTWAMVHLGIRQCGSFPRWHTNGRETFLVGVDWVDGWPVVDEERFDVRETTTSFEERFAGPALHSRWISPGAIPAEFARPQQDGLILSAGREREQRDACRLLATRVADLTWEAEVDSSDDVALVLRIDDLHQAMVQRSGTSVSARIVIGPLDQTVGAEHIVSSSATLAMRAVPFGGERGARNGPDRILLGVIDSDFIQLAELDGRYLSTEVAGGFTGRVLGVEALGADARVTRFSYRGT